MAPDSGTLRASWPSRATPQTCPDTRGGKALTSTDAPSFRAGLVRACVFLADIAVQCITHYPCHCPVFVRGDSLDGGTKTWFHSHVQFFRLHSFHVVHCTTWPYAIGYIPMLSRVIC